MYRSLCLLFIVGILLAVVPESRAGKVVVLTEKPVAEFTLPDGTVLKNAYVWKRSSEGIMIIHDDGQYYLNFKTLPPDWRKAYEVLDEIEPVKAVAATRHDQYAMFPVLDKIDALPYDALAYFESNDYPGDADGLLLMACTYQAMLNGDYDKAVRFNTLVKDHFPDLKPTIVDSWYLACKACYGKGVLIFPCVVCGGTGKCKTCDGKGEIKSQLSTDEGELPDKSNKSDDKDDDEDKKAGFGGAKSLEHKESIRCVACKGTGECPACRGTGKRSSRCAECKGYGKLLRTDEVQTELGKLAEQLTDIYRKSSR